MFIKTYKTLPGLEYLIKKNPKNAHKIFKIWVFFFTFNKVLKNILIII